jgi:hypothetical protein
MKTFDKVVIVDLPYDAHIRLTFEQYSELQKLLDGNMYSRKWVSSANSPDGESGYVYSKNLEGVLEIYLEEASKFIEKPSEVLELHEVLAENNRLSRENEILQRKFDILTKSSEAGSRNLQVVQND